MVDAHDQLSVHCQCELLGLPRSTFYYHLKPISDMDMKLMKLIDKRFTKTPFFGARRMTEHLKKIGYTVGRKKVARLMNEMGLQAIYPKRRLSVPGKDHKVYPYLLRDMTITTPDQVWCIDITYIRIRKGFVYLVAIMDWYSRYVLSWELSISLDTVFCVTALEKALRISRPEIFNSDQGAQFTSEVFTGVLIKNSIRISMDGRGRVYDNIFVERLWRSVKYEEVYIHDYETVVEAKNGLQNYFDLYNNDRQHQALAYKTPAEVYRKAV